jgi:hypothetical protein
METVLLRGGGHIAELRLRPPHGPAINCLWAAPWLTVDPGHVDFNKVAALYEAAPAGPFLAGYTGHALCLDNFGPPSKQEAELGVPLHGEASARDWSFEVTPEGCVCSVNLPVSRLHFERAMWLTGDSSVLFVNERVENRDDSDREIHWVQHLSLGPPFLAPDHCSIHASLDHAMTWPLGYEGRELLRDNAIFKWPMAPSVNYGALDLQIPFQHQGSGFVAAAHVDPASEIAHIAALNWQLGLALIYCFRRKDFPWVAIWEENCARQAVPWNGATQVRGMEFGTTPMPLGRDEIRAMGNLFDTPGSRVIPAGGTLHARYLICMTTVPASWHEITGIVPRQNSLTLIGPRSSDHVSVGAEGVREFLLKGPEEG